MSQLSNDELRALRWRLLMSTPNGKIEGYNLYRIINRCKQEIEFRKLKNLWTQPN